MEFKTWLESSSMLTAYHQTGESGLIGIVTSKKIRPGHGTFCPDPAVYFTLYPPKRNEGGMGDFLIKCVVDAYGMDIHSPENNVDVGKYARGSNGVPGFSFTNYDSKGEWLLVFDESRIRPYAMARNPYTKWFDVNNSNLEKLGVHMSDLRLGGRDVPNISPIHRASIDSQSIPKPNYASIRRSIDGIYKK